MCILMTTVTPRLKNDSILEIICLYSLQCSHHMIIVDKTDGPVMVISDGS